MSRVTTNVESSELVTEQFALAKIVAVKIADDEVVIHARRDAGDALGYYTLTVWHGTGGLGVDTHIWRERCAA